MLNRLINSAGIMKVPAQAIRSYKYEFLVYKLSFLSTAVLWEDVYRTRIAFLYLNTDNLSDEDIVSELQKILDQAFPDEYVITRFI